jgi:hypothetical protein
MRRISPVLLCLAVLAFAFSVSATTINFSFLEDGLGNLGATTNFTESGETLRAYASPGQSLYAKNEGAGEAGLGTLSDSEHEINAQNYVQLGVAVNPGLVITKLFFGSIQTATLDESVDIYYSTTLGSIGTLIGMVSAAGSSVTNSFDVSGFGYTSGYFGITAGTGNIELAGATVNAATLPDAASTAVLLGGSLSAIAVLRRRIARA